MNCLMKGLTKFWSRLLKICFYTFKFLCFIDFTASSWSSSSVFHFPLFHFTQKFIPTIHNKYHCSFADVSLLVSYEKKYSPKFQCKNISIFETFLWIIQEFKRKIGSIHLQSKSQQIRSSKQLIFATKFNNTSFVLPEISFILLTFINIDIHLQYIHPCMDWNFLRLNRLGGTWDY